MKYSLLIGSLVCQGASSGTTGEKNHPNLHELWPQPILIPSKKGMFFPKQFTVGVLNAVLSVSALAGVLCPPRWACLPICLPSGFVFHLGWGAVSASLGLSPNLSPTWLCLSPWLGCCVRLAGLVSQFVSHLALSFSLAGVLCPPRWACLRSCLPICLPSGFVFHLGWGAVSASLGLSPNLSFIWLCLSPWLGCCVRLAGLVSQFVSHLALSFTLAGVLRPPRWACLWSCLPICLPPGFVFYVGWGAVSASLGLSPNLSPNLSPTWLCLSPWLGCCVRLAGLVSGLVSHLVSHLVWDAVSASLVLSFSCLRSCLRPCLPSWLGCCVRLAGLSPVLSPSLSPIWSGMLCPPRWSCLSLVCGLVSGLVCHLGWDAVSASLGCLRSCLPACLPSGLGCSVRLPGLVFLLSLALSPSFCLCFVS